MVSRRAPDEQTMRAGIAMAVRAPSVHNSQPWRWRIGDRSVHLYVDRERWLSAIDPEGRDLVLSCGAALHHLRVALAAMGWRTRVHRLPNPAEPDHLAAVELLAQSPEANDVELAAAIPLRRTDRRRFGSWEVPEQLIALLADRARDQGAVLQAVTDPMTRHLVVTAMAEAGRLQRGDPAYADELAAWTGHVVGSEGVLTASLPASIVHAGVPLREFPGGVLAEPAYSVDEEDAGVLALMATTTDDRSAWLRAGEATSAVLLEATNGGLASGLLSQALEVPDIRAAVRREAFTEALYPQLAVRLGWVAVRAEPLPPTPRRPLSEVVEPLA